MDVSKCTGRSFCAVIAVLWLVQLCNLSYGCQNIIRISVIFFVLNYTEITQQYKGETQCFKEKILHFVVCFSFLLFTLNFIRGMYLFKEIEKDEIDEQKTKEQ
jgi:hypothetical protein